MSPQTAQYRDHTGRLRASVAIQLVPVPHSFHPEDGGNMSIRNVGILPHHYTVSQRTRILIAVVLAEEQNVIGVFV